jgi:hypothetical protein
MRRARGGCGKNIGSGVASLEHKQRRQLACADHAAVGGEVRRLELEEADRISGKCIDPEGDDQRIGSEAANALQCGGKRVLPDRE